MCNYKKEIEIITWLHRDTKFPLSVDKYFTSKWDKQVKYFLT